VAAGLVALLLQSDVAGLVLAGGSACFISAFTVVYGRSALVGGALLVSLHGLIVVTYGKELRGVIVNVRSSVMDRCCVLVCSDAAFPMVVGDLEMGLVIVRQHARNLTLREGTSADQSSPCAFARCLHEAMAL
jgi:hypothetical protein